VNWRARLLGRLCHPSVKATAVVKDRVDQADEHWNAPKSMTFVFKKQKNEFLDDVIVF
jgi:hypothetical protein